MTVRLRAAVALVALVAAAAAALGTPVRATLGGQAAVDEPEYLLTALSLWEDRDISTGDELRAQRWRAYHDRELPVQTRELPGGRAVSPHDPLLPLLLAAPVGLGGWVAAKLALSALAGVLAGLLLWTAVVRYAVPLRVAAPVVAVAASSAPLAVYGSQVYPELPAALAVTTAVAALAGPPGRRATAVWLAAVVALPWLSVKYAPAAAVLALLGLRREAAGRRATAVWTLAAAGAVYAAVHLRVWGGLTAYASGDHFVESGELGVVGFAPDHLARTARVVGLLTDRGAGLAAWQPAWLLAVPALAALLVRRPPGWGLLAAPLAAGWATATWLALTAHGFWWPGRQVVVVLPLLVLAVAVWLAHSGRAVRVAAAVLGGAGVVTYGWLLVDGWAGRVTWVTRPQGTGAPTYRWLRPLLPDLRRLDPVDVALHTGWVAVVVALALLAARAAARPRGGRGAATAAPGRRSVTVVVVAGLLVSAAALRRDDGTLVREPVVAGEPRTDAPLEEPLQGRVDDD